MLSLMRRKAKSWFIKLALGIVAVVFIFWGVGSYSTRQSNRVALVNGQVITPTEYNELYRNLLENARRSFGDALTDDLVKQLDLKGQTMETLISQSLALQAAERAGIRISDKTVSESIQSDPAFQREGKFSPELYQRLLAANNLQLANFEEDRRKRITLDRMNARLELLAQASLQEARNFFHWQRDEVKISYLAFETSSFEGGIDPGQEDLAAFYAKNKEAYRVPEKVILDYLTFKPQDYLAQAEVSPERVREIYDLTMDSYIQPERIKIRDILLPLEEEADQAEKDRVRAEAEALLKRAQDGEDFLALAKEREPGQDPSRPLEWLTRDNLDPALAGAAFGLDKGGLGGPVETGLGYHVFLVEDKEPARQKAFEEVRAEIEAGLKKEKAKELARNAAESAYGLSVDVKSMAELGGKIGLKAGQAGPFSRNDPSQDPLADPKVLEVAFDLGEGEVGPAVELEDGYYLLMVSKKLPSLIPALEEVAGEVRRDLIQEEAKAAARKTAEGLLQKAKEEGWLKASQETGVQVQLPPPFTRRGQVEGLGYDNALTEAAFRLSPGNPLPDKIFEVGNSFVVFHFEDRLKASEEVFEKNKEPLIQAIKRQRSQELSAAWMGTLRQRADVEISKDLL